MSQTRARRSARGHVAEPPGQPRYTCVVGDNLSVQRERNDADACANDGRDPARKNREPENVRRVIKDAPPGSEALHEVRTEQGLQRVADGNAERGGEPRSE